VTDAPKPLRDPLTLSLRDKARSILQDALAAVEPQRLVLNAIAHLPTPLKQAIEQRRGQLVVVAAGKAALGMAAGAEAGLPERAIPPGKMARRFVPPLKPTGFVITKDGAPGPRPKDLSLRLAGHPVPDSRGVAAAAEVIEMLKKLDQRDVCVVLLSGGSSALLTYPVEGVTIGDIRKTTHLLVKAGAPIRALNAVRKHLSQTAGGRLAAAAAPALVLSFVISDVPGNRLDTIGSGPTVPDPSTFADALAVIDKAKVRDKVPAGVIKYLESGAKGEQPETLKAGDPAFQRSRTMLIGTSRTALDAAAERATALGYKTVVLEDELIGEACQIGVSLGENLKRLADDRRGPLALIAGGETTVRVTGDGAGGRNQEVATAAASVLAGTRGVVLLTAGTDGEDGPTDAAGGIVDGYTTADATAHGVDLAAALKNNDTYPALKALDALLTTGPTGTNVMDVAIGLVG
jgi:glycerate-2-kinase